MEAITFKPKDKKELELLKTLGRKMNIKFSIAQQPGSKVEQEDESLVKLTLEGRTGKRVSKDEVMKFLKT